MIFDYDYMTIDLNGMKTSKNFSLTIAAFLLLLLLSCDKEKSEEKYTGKAPCFDGQLYEQHKNDICPDYCIGVIGCDGKTYCNSCYALRQGIKVNL
jgi:hypothetical protein